MPVFQTAAIGSPYGDKKLKAIPKTFGTASSYRKDIKNLLFSFSNLRGTNH
jgi:hypothetical protein